MTIKLTLIWIIAFFLTISSATATDWITKNQTDFNQGTYNQTMYSNNKVTLLFNVTEIYNTSNLIGWWKLDNNSAFGENASLVYDYSGNNHNGTPAGGATANSSGYFNGSYSFDGINGVISLGNNALGNVGATDFTIEAWIKTNASTGYNMILTEFQAGVCGDAVFGIYNPGFIHYDDGGGTVNNGNVSVADGNWHHVVYVRNATNGITYADGVMGADTTYANWNNGCNVDVEIGKRVDGYSFNGSIDSLRIYSRALSSTEILENYNAKVNYTNGTYTSKIFDATRNATWVNLSFNGTGETLNWSYRSCQIANCSDGNWSNQTTNTTYNLNETTRYFQWKFNLLNDTITPELYNYSVQYILSNLAPNESGRSPANGTDYPSSQRGVELKIICTDPEGDNVSALFYGDTTNGATHLYTSPTPMPSGTQFNYTWQEAVSRLNLNTTYKWDVLCLDTNGAITSTDVWQFSIEKTEVDNLFIAIVLIMLAGAFSCAYLMFKMDDEHIILKTFLLIATESIFLICLFVINKIAEVNLWDSSIISKLQISIWFGGFILFATIAYIILYMLFKSVRNIGKNNPSE